MPRNSRKNLSGFFHHVMSQGINKEYIFTEDNFKEKYRNILRDKMKQNDIKIFAYCIMDNHVHLLIYVEQIENMCKFMQQVNTTYAKFYNKFHDRVGYVFRNRYLSKSIIDQNQLKRCIVYIHKNPFEAKIVKREDEYKFSSYNEYIKNMKEKIIDINSNNKIFGEITIKEFREEYINIHNCKDNRLKEFREFNDLEEKNKIDMSELLNKYCYLSENERILKLSLEENISERKLADIFNKTRYQIRKILKMQLETMVTTK